MQYLIYKEDQLHISYKKISANGNKEKRDIDGLSPAASPELANQLLMELKTKTTKTRVSMDFRFIPDIHINNTKISKLNLLN